MTFKSEFAKFVCEGDRITCTVGQFDCTATLYRDDWDDSPDERDCGFWPSLDPKSAGYIGAKSKRSLARHMAKAKNVMRAWKADEWHYFGVVVTVEKNGVELVGRYDHALWGIEGNYPGADNSYLRCVANELLPEALAAAQSKLEQLAA
jgi:hypothetical protein